MSFVDASDLLLEWIICGVGALWLVGAVFLFISLRREAMLDGMIAKLDTMAADLDAAAPETGDGGYGDIDAPVVRPVKSDAEKAAGCGKTAMTVRGDGPLACRACCWPLQVSPWR